ncbi:MAG: carboxypeptidase-like regulatory domain-containing protein, partial [Porphyromonadaceae bacterium]|nr:carboxypeptidase-like regulatory domain-containing protein [Porphyromonadaceae bacterium]
MKRLKTLCALLCCLCCMGTLSAQNYTKLSGIVLDENDAPLPGVTISVNGKGATLSASDGSFVLTNIEEGANITFSFIGYRTTAVKMNNPKTIEAIRLVPADNAMKEVTVVGYGKQERRDITGSVSSVKLNEQKSF